MRSVLPLTCRDRTRLSVLLRVIVDCSWLLDPPLCFVACDLSGNSGGAASSECSGKTVVFDARADGTDYPQTCWVAKPTGNGDVLVFDGSLLHGVLPGRCRGGDGDNGGDRGSGGDASDDMRLTLMVGFWLVDINGEALLGNIIFLIQDSLRDVA